MLTIYTFWAPNRLWNAFLLYLDNMPLRRSVRTGDKLYHIIYHNILYRFYLRCWLCKIIPQFVQDNLSCICALLNMLLCATQYATTISHTVLTLSAACWTIFWAEACLDVQWNLSVTTTLWETSLPSGANLGGQGPPRWAPGGRHCKYE